MKTFLNTLRQRWIEWRERRSIDRGEQARDLERRLRIVARQTEPRDPRRI